MVRNVIMGRITGLFILFLVALFANINQNGIINYIETLIK